METFRFFRTRPSFSHNPHTLNPFHQNPPTPPLNISFHAPYMEYYNQFSGIFKYGCGAYSFHDREHYRFVFSIIFHNAEHKFVKDISDRFYEKVDDFVFCGSYEKWDRSGALNITYLFAIMIGNRIGVVDQFMNQLIAPEYEELIAPIQSF